MEGQATIKNKEHKKQKKGKKIKEKEKVIEWERERRRTKCPETIKGKVKINIDSTIVNYFLRDGVREERGVEKIIKRKDKDGGKRQKQRKRINGSYWSNISIFI